MGEALEEIEETPLEAGAADALARAKKALSLVQGNEPVLDQALTRTGQLVRQLRLTGRGDTEQPVPVDVNDLIEGTLILLTHELKNDVTVDLQLGDVPPVNGWPGPLGQVFLNLILNAQQAMEGTGTDRDHQRGRKWPGDREGGRRLAPGCRIGHRKRIFQPGWTSKSEDEGTGLGLFISQRIVERHAGNITAGNSDSGGAEFVVTLPPATEGSPEARV